MGRACQHPLWTYVTSWSGWGALGCGRHLFCRLVGLVSLLPLGFESRATFAVASSLVAPFAPITAITAITACRTGQAGSSSEGQ